MDRTELRHTIWNVMWVQTIPPHGNTQTVQNDNFWTIACLFCCPSLSIAIQQHVNLQTSTSCVHHSELSHIKKICSNEGQQPWQTRSWHREVINGTIWIYSSYVYCIPVKSLSLLDRKLNFNRSVWYSWTETILNQSFSLSQRCFPVHYTRWGRPTTGTCKLANTRSIFVNFNQAMYHFPLHVFEKVIFERNKIWKSLQSRLCSENATHIRLARFI